MLFVCVWFPLRSDAFMFRNTCFSACDVPFFCRLIKLDLFNLCYICLTVWKTNAF